MLEHLPRLTRLAPVALALCFACTSEPTPSQGSGGRTGVGGGATGGATGSGGTPASGTGGGIGPGSGGVVGPVGGTGGASNPGTGGGGGTGSGGSSAARPFFTEDFESGTPGMQPMGWDNFIGYVKNSANTMQQNEYALVDGQRAHGGSRSVHIKGSGNPAMITRPLPAGTNRLFVRMYVYLTRQLGMQPTPPNMAAPNHETLLGIRKTPGNANDEVRFGEIKGAIGTNEVPSDNISPVMASWGQGPVVAPNRWACIEVAFLADQAQHTLSAWADNVLVHSITSGNDWNNIKAPVWPMNWMNGKFVEVIFGWHSFSGIGTELWMDDIALGTERIGCN